VKELALIAFGGALFAMFRLAAGAPEEWGLYLPVLILATLALEIPIAILWPKTRSNVLFGVAALVAQPALLVMAMFAGRQWHTWQVEWHLDEYQLVVDRELAELAQSKRAHLEEREPHPDFVQANAYLDPSGESLVVFSFADQPRSTLLFARGSSPPAVSDGLCLQTLAPHWFWYRTC
jgi:hypothetical protein